MPRLVKVPVNKKFPIVSVPPITGWRVTALALPTAYTSAEDEQFKIRLLQPLIPPIIAEALYNPNILSGSPTMPEVWH